MTIVCRPWTGFGILIPVFIIAGLIIGGVRSMSRTHGEITSVLKFAGLSPLRDPKKEGVSYERKSEVQTGLCTALVSDPRD